MADRTCSIVGCETKVRARGWCATHWSRWRRNGDPSIATRYVRVPIEDRFWAHVEKTDSCWVWTGARNDHGYGQLSIRRPSGKWTMCYAHRYSYELLVAPIPSGMVIDHICHNPSCVKPGHLRPCSVQQNAQNRGAGRNSKSGVRGVYWNGRAWQAQVRHAGKMTYIGTYDNLSEASEAARQARNAVFTHNDTDRDESR